MTEYTGSPRARDRQHITVAAWSAAALAAVAALGWFLDLPVLAGEWLSPSTMKLPTLVGLVLGAALLLMRRPAPQRTSPPLVTPALVTAASVALLAIGAAILAASLPVVAPWHEALIDFMEWAPRGEFVGPPSPLLGAAFAVLAAGAWRDRQGGAARESLVVALWLAMTAVFGAVGVLMHAPAPAGSYFTQLSEPTILGIALLAYGEFLLHPETAFVRRLRAASPAGVALRRLLVAAIVVPAGLGVLRTITHVQGLLEPLPGIATYALTMSVALAAIGWWVSQQVEVMDAERRRALEQMAASEALFRQAFEHTGIGMAIVGLDGRWLRVNAAVAEIVGYTPAELHRLTFQDITHPADLAADTAFVRELIAGERQWYTMAKRYVRRDGSIAHVQLTASLARSPEGQPLHFLSAIQDITDRVTAEQALDEAHRFQRDLTEAADLSIIATYPDGVIRSFNPGAERMLGYAAEELVGRATPERLHLREEVVARAAELSVELAQPIAAGFDAFVAKARRDGVDQQEWTYVRKDGSHLRVQLSVTCLRDSHGAITGYLGIASNVTAMREAYQALTQADAEKAVLLREVHHRVKNNLQVVSSMLNLQAGALDDEAARVALQASRDRVRTMAVLHERLQTGGGGGAVDFGDYVKELVALHRAAAPPAVASVPVKLEAEPLVIPLDLATPLGLVLNELLANAYKHGLRPAASGGIRVTIAGVGPELVLAVENDGPPLPEDVERAPTLGLRLVRALVAQVDGRVEFERHPRTTVRVRLPWPAAARRSA